MGSLLQLKKGSIIKKDKRMLVMAAAQAQKAADLILNRKGGETVDDAEIEQVG